MARITPRLRPLLAATAVLALGAGAVGCSGGSNSSRITVLMEDISWTDNIKALLPEFEKETGIKVVIETVPYSDQAAKILQEFAQKSSYYDVVFTDNVYGTGFYESGYVVDLTDLAAKDSHKYVNLADFYKPYLAPMQTQDGKTFGLPVYGESTFLMYRTDLFEQFGIDHPPTTMEELREDARIIHEGTNGETAGITLRGAPGIQSVYPWAGFLRAFGGDFFDESGAIAIDSPESVKATEFWAGLLQDYGPAGAANFDWEQNRIAFTQGQAAMTIDATANGPYNEDPDASKVAGKVGYAPVPYAEGVSPKGGNTDNSLNVHALYLSAYSKNQADAYAFMSWATSKKVQDNAVDTIEAVGVTLESVLSGPAYAERYGAFQQAVLDQLATGNVNYLPSGQDANTIIVETGQALSIALSGSTPSGDAMAAAAQNIASQLGDG